VDIYEIPGMRFPIEGAGCPGANGNGERGTGFGRSVSQYAWYENETDPEQRETKL